MANSGDNRDVPQFSASPPDVTSAPTDRTEGASLPETVLWTSLGITEGERAGVAKTPGWPVIPGYEILGELGKGGMGVVYKARDLRLNRLVALKMILAGRVAGAAQVRRFQREAEAAAHLDHPGIVPVYGFGEHKGQHYLALGLIEGASLHARLAAGPLDNRAAGYIVRAIAEAIDYAHRRGIVHRDLKPANILLGRDGQARVTDFGIARRTGVADEHEADEALGLVPRADVRRMTVTGSVLGTPSFMAPEQALDAKRVGPAADIYAIGAILYALLTGRPPFLGTSLRDTLELVVGSEPVPPRQLNPGADRGLETICLTCLNKEPRRRYATAADLAADLDRWGRGEPPQARRMSRLERLAHGFETRGALLPVIAGMTARALVGPHEGVFVGCVVAGMTLKLVAPHRLVLIAGALAGALFLPLPGLFPADAVTFPSYFLGCAGGALLVMLLMVARKSVAVLGRRGGISWDAWTQRLTLLVVLASVALACLAAFIELIFRSPHTDFDWLAHFISLVIGGTAALVGFALVAGFLLSLWITLVQSHRRLAGRGIGIALAPAGLILLTGGLVLGYVFATHHLLVAAVDGVLDTVRDALFEPNTDFLPRLDSESGWSFVLAGLNHQGFGVLGLLAAIPLGIGTGLFLGALKRWLARLRLPNAGSAAAAFLLGAVVGGILWQAWLAGLDWPATANHARLGQTPATLVAIRVAQALGGFHVGPGWTALVLIKMALLVVPMATGGLIAAGLTCAAGYLSGTLRPAGATHEQS